MRARAPLSCLLAALLAVLTSSSAARAGLQDEADAAASERTASERLGMRPGKHSISLFGGFFRGGTALDAGIETPPLDEELAQLKIDIENGSLFGLRYGYQAHEHWMVEGSLSFLTSELQNNTSFDPAAAEILLANAERSDGTELSDADRETLINRIESRDRPVDADLTLFDVSAVYLINPDGRWIGEVGAGLGWVDSSLGEEPAIFEELKTNNCDPTDTNCFVRIANEIADPTNGTGCPANDDPCVVLNSDSSLSWHVLGGLRFAFNDQVHLRLGTRVWLIEGITDPGDSLVAAEGTVGVSFLFGGDR